VLIEATIAEVTLNDALNYGTQFYLGNKFAGILTTSQPTGTTSSTTSTTTTGNTAITVEKRIPGQRGPPDPLGADIEPGVKPHRP
jgi:type II secretory pathway component GspD/PulD (secretin)